MAGECHVHRQPMAAGHPPKENGRARSQYAWAAAGGGADRRLATGSAACGAAERHTGARGGPWAED
eukprot:3828773-Prorocentrum_lima.AAC.1